LYIHFINVRGDPNVKTNYRFSFDWEECVENFDLLEIWVRWEREEGKISCKRKKARTAGGLLGDSLIGSQLMFI